MILLLCFHDTSPGVLHPVLGSPAWEGHGPAGVSPEEDHNNDQRAGAPLLCRQTDRAGAAQSGQAKALGRPYHSFQFLKGATRELERDFACVGIEERGMALRTLLAVSNPIDNGFPVAIDMFENELQSQIQNHRDSYPEYG
ncbi:hypothetical protein HGM15179_000973 [Zosterops borbonicus]|uniref:Uncharacterized protein n=1 Tax=Zosterops borbonicus TaxID=364589 RepID=A0A8K1GXT5_9PASS|nr:hypothetical protein HGM15179_000973 [Zosterops borbonicus]